MHGLKDFADTLPDYAKDLRLNLGSILSDQLLGDQRKYGCCWPVRTEPAIGRSSLPRKPKSKGN